MIDADPQGSLTASLGYQEPDDIRYTLATIMMKIINEEEIDPAEGILHHEEGVDLVPAVAAFCFLLYAALTGVTFSIYFLAFDLSVLVYAFGATALFFGGMAAASLIF